MPSAILSCYFAFGLASQYIVLSSNTPPLNSPNGAFGKWKILKLTARLDGSIDKRIKLKKIIVKGLKINET